MFKKIVWIEKGTNFFFCSLSFFLLLIYFEILRRFFVWKKFGDSFLSFCLRFLIVLRSVGLFLVRIYIFFFYFV